MNLFLTKRFYIVAAFLIVLFIVGNTFAWLFTVAKVLVALWILVTLVDIGILYINKEKMDAVRTCKDRFSNGDENEVHIAFNSPYAFPTKIEIIDEMPVDFQMREFILKDKLEAHEQRELKYSLTPKTRGVYQFDHIRLFFSSPIGLVQRRFTRGTPQEVKVYPSFSHLSLYSLMAQNHHLNEYGIKRIRQVGVDTDFEQIKDYVQGDEYRHINWKASARTNSLKVNVYQQERSLQLFSIIDKGRMMQQAFNNLTFLEYSINASLALSYVATKKDDKVGLTTFSKDVDTFVPASKQGNHMQKLMEALYHQQTIFEESDYSALATTFVQKVTKRSLVILFANFATENTMKRELPYLRQISNRHRLLVIVFKDRQMEEYVDSAPTNTEEYYQHVLVEKYIKDKELIIKTLRMNGISTLFTFPENLSVDIINKYIEVRRF